MVHVICRASDSRIVPPALPDQLQKVIHAGQDVVHEDDAVEIFSLRVPEFMQGHECCIPHLGEVLDSMIERASCPHGRPNGDAHTNAPRERVEYSEQRFCLVRGPVLVDGHKDILVTQDGGHAEKRREEIGDDVEGVVQIDGEEVLVLRLLQVPPDSLWSIHVIGIETQPVPE